MTRGDFAEAMDDGEDLRTPLGTRGSGGLPAHRAMRRGGNGSRPVLWSNHDVVHSPEPVFGAFPKSFIPWALRLLNAPPKQVLHVCSGSMTSEHTCGGIRVDIARRAAPDVIADGCALPFLSDSFRAVLLDPPYSKEYAETLYGTKYPKPSHLLAEAARVVKPGGRIAMLHFLVPHPPSGAKLIEVHGVTQGCGYRIRALTIFQKEASQLFPAPGAEVKHEK